MERTGLKNLMEILVEQQYNAIKNALCVCQCDRCRLDMMSYALNRLQPRYVVTERGEAMSRVESMSVQFDSDIICLLTQAAQVVKEHPRHDIVKDADKSDDPIDE